MKLNLKVPNNLYQNTFYNKPISNSISCLWRTNQKVADSLEYKNQLTMMTTFSGTFWPQGLSMFCISAWLFLAADKQYFIDVYCSTSRWKLRYLWLKHQTLFSLSLAWASLAWPALARHGLDWPSLAWPGLAWPCLALPINGDNWG